MALNAVALAATFALTGWLFAAITVPERVGPARRAGLTLALSIPATVCLAAPGAVVGRWNLALIVIAIGILVVVVGVRHARCASDLPLQLRLRLSPRSRRLLIALPAALALIWFTVLDPQLGARRADGLPLQTTGGYYWWLVEAVDAEDGFPETIPEWGRERPFPTDYTVSTLHAAATAELAGGTDLGLLRDYGIALVFLGLIAFFALWSRWLPPWWAALAGVLCMAAVLPRSKFLTYRPETAGLVLVLWSSWLLDEALARRSPRWGALAGLVSASAYLAHAEIWVLTLPLWAGIVCGRVLARERPRRRGARRRALAPTLTVAALTLVVCVAIPSVAIGGGSVAEVVGLGGPSRVDGTAFQYSDPTWALYAAILEPQNVDGAPHRYCRDPLAVTTVRQPWSGVSVNEPGTAALAVLAGLVLLAASGLALRRRRGRAGFLGPGGVRALTTWTVFLCGIVLVAGAFCLAFDTFVPERAGYQRLLPYYVLGAAGALTALGRLGASTLFAASFRLAPRRVRRRRGVVLGLASVAILVPTVALVSVLTGRTIHHRSPQTGIAPVAYEAYAWMHRSLPPGSIVLANAYTEGAIGSLAGQIGWLDGRLPYLEDSEWREQAIAALLDARAFFRAPRGNIERLPAEVDYVLAAFPRINLGGPQGRRRNPFEVKMRALQKMPTLRPVRSFGAGRVRLFVVVR